MKCRYLIQLAAVFFCVQTQAQPGAAPFSTIDLPALCKILGTEKRIIGLGESTHGTREFTSIRTEVVKTLVTQYNYRAIVLEADFVPCEKINSFIAGGKGDIEKLLIDQRLWPWIQEDFLNLLIWLKEYNQQHQTGPVRFYGMDSQYTGLFAKKDSVLLHDFETGTKLFSIIDGSGNPREKIKALRKLDDQLSDVPDSIDLEMHYYLLCYLHKLSLAEKGNTDTRDENMARFVQLIQKKYGDSLRMILWGKNSHISKQGPALNERTAAGYHLSKLYGNAYAAIGQDFKEGTFLAVDYENKTERKIKPFLLKPTRQTLAASIDFTNTPFLVVNCSSLKESYSINAIGAIYVREPGKKNAFYSKIKKDKEYDYLIISAVSTPIRLLSSYLNKMQP
ncbi:MAG: erythromycin esterase family protein [Chitinophagaceae bacterium]|jgi:erythromycin esterase|nr:erythromycin esterase family protein [Chitinophagaceae bacterium]